MEGYRAYILGSDGHVRNRVDLICEDEAEAIRLAKNSSMGTTSNFGSWIV